MKNIVNIAVQFLPIGIDKKLAYEAVDVVIEKIKHSGIKYQVCPFETVMEGDYDTIMQVVKEAQIIVIDKYAEHLLVNIKIQSSRNKDIAIEDKTGKYL